jgi:hypothetical protein
MSDVSTNEWWAKMWDFLQLTGQQQLSFVNCHVFLCFILQYFGALGNAMVFDKQGPRVL